MQKNIYLILLYFSFAVGIINSSLGSDSENQEQKWLKELNEDGVIDFNEHVRPILSNTCFNCHGPDEKKRDADLALHTLAYATQELVNSPGKYAIVPGNPEESEAIKRVYTEDADDLMPPVDSIHKLSAKQKWILKEWVKQGAHYKEHWAYIKPTKNTPQFDSSWAKNEIDLFIEAELKKHNLTPAEPASKEEWLRRVTLSLTGLQATPQELQAFKDDTNPNAKEKVVDRLLASPRYGEHMALSWIDAARYADTDGYQNDQPRENWPWRDYVIKSFNENKGYDQFTIEQLAGDMLPNPTHEQLIATAFNRNHRQNNEGGALPEEFLIENVLDRVDTVGTIYLGLTMSCARCHDHKYDLISQKEFFQFSGYFNNLEGEKGRAPGVGANPILMSTSLYSTKEVQEQVEKLNMLLNDRQSIVDLDKKNNKKYKEDPRYKEITEGIEQLKAKIRESSPDHPNLARVMVMQEKDGKTPTYLLNRGQYDDPDVSEELSRTVPKALLGDSPPPKDRLELARWLMSEENAITARVTVNRIWQHHFGQGIVSTPEDFGSQSAFPTHLGLIDWLAVDFRESGWDMKKLHKKIVLSATYSQSSKATLEDLVKDETNQWLSRGPRFRLTGAALRDQALYASGMLHEKVGGNSVKPHQPEGLWASVAGYIKDGKYKLSKGKDLYRRSLYTYWKRAVNPPRHLIFDAPTREICSVAQNRTNTPLQALVLLNDITFVEAAIELALRFNALDIQSSIKQVYEYATGYSANDSKMRSLQKSYQDFYQYYANHINEAKEFLANSPEAKDIPEEEVLNYAALSMLAHTILNTDEIINN